MYERATARDMAITMVQAHMERNLKTDTKISRNCRIGLCMYGVPLEIRKINIWLIYFKTSRI